MTYFEDLAITGDTFEDRDQPSALCSALGRLALAYAALQQRVEETIGVLLDETAFRSPDPLEDLSFERKVDLLGDLISTAQLRVRFNTGDPASGSSARSSATPDEKSGRGRMKRRARATDE